MSMIGIFAMALFVIGILGAMVSYFAFGLGSTLRKQGMSIWRAPESRTPFLIFMGFCSLGPISVLIGYFLGGWPQS